MCGVLSWLFLGLGAALYVHDRILEAPNIHPGLHGIDAGAIYLIVAWLFGWIVITYCTDFWYAVKLALGRIRLRRLTYRITALNRNR